MNVDAFEGPAKALIAEISGGLDAIETEADARFQIIDRFFIEALGWDRSDFKMEPHNPSGYTDYLLRVRDVPTLVVEAKRVGELLVNTVDPKLGKYKVGGPALKSASEGFTQAATYCIEHGVDFAALTSGPVWIAFMAFRTG